MSLPGLSRRALLTRIFFTFAGTISVFFIIGLVIYWASVWGVNVDFSDVKAPEYVPMFKSTFPSLSGLLALGLFIHNAIVTITSNHEHPEKNVSSIRTRPA